AESANGARRADLGEACATGAPAEHAGEAIHVEVVRPLEPGDRSVDEVLTPAGKVELRHARHDGQILPFLYRPVDDSAFGIASEERMANMIRQHQKRVLILTDALSEWRDGSEQRPHG